MEDRREELSTFESCVLIGLNRLYDIQMSLLATVNPELADDLVSMHEQGRTLAPPAAILVEDGENDLETE